MMVCVRKYVDWLWERGVTAAPGRELILGSDLPKKPEYLPRPLPADNDRELQQKLKDDESKVSQLGTLRDAPNRTPRRGAPAPPARLRAGRP
jgi:site-specific recombinase XerC